MPPSRIGKYDLIESIGSGGMAEVFRARFVDPTGRPREVAIKRLSEELSGDAKLVAMFVEEAQLAAMLTHPNIVQLHEFGTDEQGRAFMVLEFVDGRDLRWCLATAAKARYWLPLPFALTIARDLCRGLAHAHEATGPDGSPLLIVHRDVTHSNVFLSRKGEVKLADFGIARARGRQSQTRTGLVRGKIGYLSPEQVRALPLDARSDVFSASVVLWELLTQRRLFSGETEFKTMLAVCSQPREGPTRYRPDLPAELDPLVLRGLEINRDNRYRSAREMGTAIEQLARRLGVGLGPEIIADCVRYLDDFEQKAEGKRPAPTPPSVRPIGGSAPLGAPSAPPAASRPPAPSPPLASAAPTSAAPSEGPPRPSQIAEPFGSKSGEFQSVRTSIIPGLLPLDEARGIAIRRESPERPLYLHSAGEVQAAPSVLRLLRILDPRAPRLVDAVSADGQHWMPLADFARLAELDFAVELRRTPPRGAPTGPSTLIGRLADASLSGFNGSVLTEERERFGMLLELGGLVAAMSTNPLQQLVSAIAAGDLLPSPESLLGVLGEVIQSGRRLVDVLESTHGISPESLVPLRKAVALEIVRDMLPLHLARPWVSPATPGTPRKLLAGTPLELVMHGTAVAWSDADVERGLEPFTAARLRVMPGLPLVARMLRLRRLTAPILRKIRTGRSVDEVVAGFNSSTDAGRLARRLCLIFIHSGAVAATFDSRSAA